MIKNETINNILTRRSIRKYKDRQLTEDEINTLLECAMWAPSARNMQPCHVRAVMSKEILEGMNRDFKDIVGWDAPAYTNWSSQPFYQNAPSVIFVFAQEYKGVDGGIMAENIAVAAKSMGLGSCIIASIAELFKNEKGDKWKKAMDIPENYQFLISVAVGEGDEEPEPKERNKAQFKIIK